MCVRPPRTKGSCHCCLTRQEFLANNPSLTEIRSEILHYATFEQEIDELKPIIVVGALELHTGNVNSVTRRSRMGAGSRVMSIVLSAGHGCGFKGTLRWIVGSKELLTPRTDRPQHGGALEEGIRAHGPLSLAL